jgi:hypothetical protein
VTIVAMDHDVQDDFSISEPPPHAPAIALEQCEPDRLSYQYRISALVRSNLVDEACQLLEQLQTNNSDDDNDHQTATATGAMYDVVIAAYAKQSNREGVQRVHRIRESNLTTERKSSSSSSPSVPHYYSFQGLTKVGKGKSYWEVATYLPLNITIGVKPCRDPVKNGIQLVFYENDECEHPKKWERRKLGFLLMKNSGNQSTLLGMQVFIQRRGQGIAKVCLGAWLWFCLQAGITPTTGIISKPLLALLLQSRFGFVPRKGGTEVELAPDPTNPETVLVYAASQKSLRGVFSAWDKQHQTLRLVQQPPDPPGRLVKIRTSFEAPVELRQKVEEILPEGALECDLTPNEIRRLYLGRTGVIKKLSLETSYEYR